MNDKNNNSLKIYVVSHKKFAFENTPFYEPIQVNGAKNEHFCNVTDDTGDNISIKNNRFCELTALYWIWKNDKENNFIGISHYRRFFKFNAGLVEKIRHKWQYESPEIRYKNIQVTPSVIKELQKGKAIVPKPYLFGESNVQTQYEVCHSASDLDILKKVCLQKYPDYQEAWEKIMQAHKVYTFNMFIMNRDEYDKYCTWLFDILFEVEKLVPPKEDAYQNRTFGFMSERLFNVYLEQNKLPVAEYPILFITQG